MKLHKSFIPDLIAGLTVSFAALSLGAAFGVMSGRGAFAGMLSAAIIPIVTSLLGGTRLQASGPTAPMTAITALLVASAYDQFGEPQLANQFITLVLFMASVFIFCTGLFRLGRFIKWVPQVVVLGFMNGIGVLIWVDQIKKIAGLGGQSIMEGNAMINLGVAMSTLLMIYFIPFLLRKLKVPTGVRRFVPAIFITIIIATVFTSVFSLDIQHVSLGKKYDSIGSFIDILVSFFPSHPSIFTQEMILKAIPLALQLCLLSYLDSLLTSLVIDKMTQEKTKPDKELLAQGLANGIAALLQGIPGAQATIRSVLLIKEGAQTRMAGVFVGIFALLGFLVFSNLITLIASAVFTGVLFKAGLDVMDRDFPITFFKNGWMNNRTRLIQFFIIIYTSFITVVIDLNVAVITGTIIYYIGKKYLGFVDVEDNFAQVNANELEGQSINGKDQY